MVIAISSPPEDNRANSRDAHITLALQRLEEDKVHNLEKKEHMTMRDGKFAIIMQQQEED